ncbi:MAG TPA: PQQ-binding-like beta-propeller repeat protein [Candidatus Acidoferrum sp.]|nr:PQQ-binding-like beta-propeller repeat protein [Candidatus Acidoferrum sp.]
MNSRKTLIFASVACVASLFFLLHSTKGDSPKAGDVTESRVATDATTGANWLLNGRTFDGKHFSPLTQINDKNVAQIGLAWYLDVDSTVGIVSEPIVVDGVAYISAPQSKIYAIDAATGKLLWKFDPRVRLGMAINGSYSARTNGGVAVWNGRVFVGTGDCRLVAVNAATGKEVWEATVCNPTQTGITGAPHIAKGRVLIGYNGSDDGVRGALVAYDADTGDQIWRFWTVPGNPAKRIETKALEMAAQTWHGNEWWRVGGGDVWNAITYDDATGLVIFGTAGTGVDYGELSNIKATGDRLFSGCIVAVDAETGEYVWHFQTSAPGMQTENNHILTADLTIDGEKRHVAMTAPKNGFFYILDAKTGKLISANPLVNTTWAHSYDLATGRANEVPPDQGGGKQWTVHNWWPMSYNDATGLVYIPSTDRETGAKAAIENGESGEGLIGRLIAWDPVQQKARWSVEEKIAVNSGVLSTAGNLVFQGQGTGEFSAYAADSGKKLWSIQTKSAIDAIPVTYSVSDEQYVLTPVGWGSGSRLFAPARTMVDNVSKYGPTRIYAFKLNGKTPFPTPKIVVPPVPQPPQQTGTPEMIKKGEKLYGTFVCDGCHSPGLDGTGAWTENGVIPDLRYMPAEAYKNFYTTVLGGTHWEKGMPGFSDPPKFAFPNMKMTVEDANAIRAFIIDGAWKLYRGQKTTAHTARENY